MSAERRRDSKIKTTVSLPTIRVPRVSRGSKNPKGWAGTQVSLRSRGWFGTDSMKKREPAGDPPAEFPGTRPEWALYWAANTLGYEQGSDFVFQAKLPGVGQSYYSTVDFLFYDYGIAVEVQGTYWHMGQGSERIFNDILRHVAYAQQGYKVIFVDEKDCLADPIFYLQEALRGIDHSTLNTGG